jgi:hypothetical protein
MVVAHSVLLSTSCSRVGALAASFVDLVCSNSHRSRHCCEARFFDSRRELWTSREDLSCRVGCREARNSHPCKDQYHDRSRSRFCEDGSLFHIYDDQAQADSDDHRMVSPRHASNGTPQAFASQPPCTDYSYVSHRMDDRGANPRVLRSEEDSDGDHHQDST